ncbi:hypothetical protein KEM55_009338 [Ascosphaera atra]|nr:hypothetical protein KEM55_009338 [Ascosphaera atra]
MEQPQQLSTEQAAPDTVPQQMPAQDVAIDNGTANGQGNVDMDMDMDIDIDLGDQHELEPAPEPEPEPMQHEYLETVRQYIPLSRPTIPTALRIAWWSGP